MDTRKFSLLINDHCLLADVARPQHWQLDSISASDKTNSKQKVSSLPTLISRESQVMASLSIFTMQLQYCCPVFNCV